MWDDLAGVPAKLVNCLYDYDVSSCQQVCRNWRKAIKTERETVVVQHAQPKALSSFANLKHLRICMCRYNSLPKCLTTLTVLHSLEIASPLGPISFPWATLSRLTSLKLDNSLTNEDSAQVSFPQSLHTLHINHPGKICLRTLPRMAELVITHGYPDSQTLPYLTDLTQLRFNAQSHLPHLEKTAIFSALAMLKSLVHLEVDGSPSSRQVKSLTSLSHLTSLALLNPTRQEETLCRLDDLRHLLSMVNLQRLTCYFCADGRSYIAETTGEPSGCGSLGAANLSDDTSESDKHLAVAFYLMSPVSSLKLAVHEETESDWDTDSLDTQHSDSSDSDSD